jgi:hypothetical protein
MVVSPGAPSNPVREHAERQAPDGARGPRRDVPLSLPMVQPVPLLELGG